MKGKNCIRRLSALCACLLLALCLVSCGDAPTDVAPDGLQTVDCEGLPYKVYMPDGWVVRREGGHIEAMLPTGASASVTVYHTATDATDEAAYFEGLLPQFSAQYKEFKADKPVAYTLAGKEGVYCAYSGKVGEDAYRMLQFLLIDGGELYILTYSAKADYYESYEESAIRVAENFSLQDKAADTPPTLVGEDALRPTEGPAFTVRMPKGWLNESRGSYVAVRDGETGASVFVAAERTDADSFADYWRSVLGAVADAYPKSILPEAEGEPKEYAYTETTLDGRGAERVDYTVVTEDGTRYRAVKIAATEDYQVFVLTFTLPEATVDTATGDDLIKEVQNAFRFE